jgi:hypothetical protein
MRVAVLSVLQAAHPAQLTVSELIHELVDDPDDFRQRLAVKQTVRHLAGVGMLRRDGIFVLPGRIAVDDERLGAVA